MEEFSNKETHTEVTAVVETSPMEEFPRTQKQKEVETLQVEEQRGKEKLQKRFNVENTCPQEKKHENTAFSNAFSQSSSSMSVYLHHIMEPSVRHAKRKFSFTSKPRSISASLCKHLTKTKKEDNSHGLEKDMQGEKRKGRENEENDGRRTKFFGKSKVVKSGEDRLRAYLPAKEGNDEHEQVSSTLPLHTGHDWYVERGRNESKNRARLQSRTTNVIDTEGGGLLGTNRSTVSGTLEQNLEAIKAKIEGKKCWKEKSGLVGVKAVGEQMYKFPIISTQEAARTFFNAFKETAPGGVL